MRVALGLEYDGKVSSGWQSQPHGNAIQDKLNRAIRQIAGEDSVHTVAAGRTDAGVHALMQVVHFDAPVDRPLQAWVRGVNALLPSEIAVLWSRQTSDDFHARFSACWRSYSYFLHTHPVRPALLAGKIGWYHQSLNVKRMQEAASLLLGRHDFSSFRSSECQAKSPVKTVYQLEVMAHQGLIRFDIKADAFLHHMVRNIVGMLVYVGKETLSITQVETLLKAQDRKAAPPTFMPDGLYLTGVGYPDSFALPTQCDPVRLRLWNEHDAN